MMLNLEMWYCLKCGTVGMDIKINFESFQTYRYQNYLKEVYVEFYALFCLLLLEVMDTQHPF